MAKGYTDYSQVTKEILDTVQVGNFIKCNNWKRPMKVLGVSENYFVMIQNLFGTIYYSVCEKKPAKYSHNSFSAGSFRIGPDHWLFGWHADKHEWDNAEWVQAYLQSFEVGESELSERRAVDVRNIFIKSAVKVAA